MTNHYRPISNTIVMIPDGALNPGVGTYYPLQQDSKSTDLFRELIDSGRAGIFQNPVSNAIDLTSSYANNLIAVIADTTNHLGSPEKANLLSTLVSNSAIVSFGATAPATTSVIEVRYTIQGNLAVMDEFVANGSQTSFNLSYDPQNYQLPSVFVNGVYQSNSAFNFVSKTYGIVELLSRLKSHTNRLSGLESAVYAEDIDLEKVVSVGTALNTLANGLDDTGNHNANNVLYCMSALFCSDILQIYRDTMAITLAPAIKTNTTNVIATYTALNKIVSGLNNILISDVEFYRQVESQLAYSTLSSFINTIHSEPAGKYLIQYLIGTDKLRTILDGD